jgi:hypothetical protein
MTDLESLGPRTVILSTLDITENLRSQLRQEAAAIDSEDDAVAVLASLLGPGANEAIARFSRDEASAIDAARRLLQLTLEDPATELTARETLVSPPEDEQMSVEAVVAVAAVLGLLVTWLQTKLQIRVTKKDGKTEVEFNLAKDAADSATVSGVVEAVKSVILPSPPV